MNIAIVISTLETGGSERQSLISAAALQARGHDVHLVTAYSGRNDYAAFIQQRGIQWIENSVPRHRRADRVRKLAGLMREARYDVVHAFNGSATRYACLAARLAHVPCIFGGYRNCIIQAPHVRWINNAVTRGVCGWIVNADPIRTFLASHYRIDPNRVFVVPNAFFPEDLHSCLTSTEARAKFGIAEDRHVVSIIANLRRVKNHEMFLRAAKRVIDRGCRPIFLAAGDGPERNHLESVSSQLGIASQVRFLGRCDCIPDVLRATDVATLTSNNEGLPNAVIEASAAGLPTVTSDNAGARQVVTDSKTGFVVPVDDDAAMANRLTQLLDDPTLRHRMGNAAKRYVLERFSADTMVRTLENIYETGLRTASRPRRHFAGPWHFGVRRRDQRIVSVDTDKDKTRP